MDHNDGSESEAYLFATQLAVASEFQAALKSAIELDLLELIKKAGPGDLLSAAKLASRIPTTNPAAPDILDRILRLLTANSVLNSTLKSLPDGSVERLYSLAPVCEFLTKNEDGVSLAPLLLFAQDNVYKASWDKFKEAFLDGGSPFHKAFGMSLFRYTETNQRYNSIFNEAMSNHSTLVMKKVLDTYHGFEGLKSLVDVGGGIGATLNMIVSKHPSIKGINFDLPHVIRRVPSCNKIGVEHVGGDMFVSVPKAEAVFMKWICHDWSDERCLKLLINCYEAIPENGKVILIESVLPDAPDDEQLRLKSINTVLQFDITMMTHIEGGRERTEMEFQALANEAGFKELRKVCCAHNFWVMELMK